MENNNNTKPKRRATVAADVYTDLYTCRQMPISDSFFEKLAIDFTNWAKDDNKALIVSQFPLSKGIPVKSFMRWCKTKKLLKDAYEDVKHIIATRREVGMLTGELKEKSNMYMMHRYDNDWDKADHRWSEINAKAQENAQSGNINVMIQAAENTDVPPMRKNADVIAEQNNKNTTKAK